MLLAALIAALTTAHAQTPVRLSSGETILEDCLGDPACGDFTRLLLSETMLEVGLTLQRDPLASSALVNRGYGLVTEFAVDSVPIGRIVSEDGTKQTPVTIPVMPRLAAGYHVGSYTFDDPYPQLGVGVFFLPPIKVSGMSAVTGGLDGSFAIPVHKHFVWVGADANYTYTRVNAQLVGTADQLENLGPLAEFINPTAVQTACDITELCRDSFTVQAGALRVGVAVDPTNFLTAYMRLGATYVHHALYIGWDDTLWVQNGLQPQFQTGLGLRIADKLQFTGGTTLVHKSEDVSTDDVRIIGKVVGSISYRWGQHRYWYKDERAVSQLRP